MAAEENSTESSTWEGNISQVTTYTGKVVGKVQATMSKKLDALYDRLVETEARDTTQERDLKTRMSKLMLQVSQEVQQVGQRVEALAQITVE